MSQLGAKPTWLIIKEIKTSVGPSLPNQRRGPIQKFSYRIRVNHSWWGLPASDLKLDRKKPRADPKSGLTDPKGLLLRPVNRVAPRVWCSQCHNARRRAALMATRSSDHPELKPLIIFSPSAVLCSVQAPPPGTLTSINLRPPIIVDRSKHRKNVPSTHWSYWYRSLTKLWPKS